MQGRELDQEAAAQMLLELRQGAALPGVQADSTDDVLILSVGLGGFLDAIHTRLIGGLHGDKCADVTGTRLAVHPHLKSGARALSIRFQNGVAAAAPATVDHPAMTFRLEAAVVAAGKLLLGSGRLTVAGLVFHSHPVEGGGHKYRGFRWLTNGVAHVNLAQTGDALGAIVGTSEVEGEWEPPELSRLPFPCLAIAWPRLIRNINPAA